MNEPLVVDYKPESLIEVVHLDGHHEWYYIDPNGLQVTRYAQDTRAN